MSLLDGKVCMGRRTYLLSPVKSTMSCNSPLALLTKNLGAHQSEGSDIVAMTLLSISCWIAFLAFSSQWCGTGLAVDIWKGSFLPGVRKIFIGEPPMDSSGNESVSTSWKSLMRELRMAWIWVDLGSTLRRGKPLGMTSNLLRSLNPTIISSLIAGDMTADVFVRDDGAWSTISTTPTVGTESPLTETKLGGRVGLVTGIWCFNAMSEESNVVALPVSGKQEKGKESLRWEIERGKQGATSSSSRLLGWASVTLRMVLPTRRLYLSERHTEAM